VIGKTLLDFGIGCIQRVLHEGLYYLPTFSHQISDLVDQDFIEILGEGVGENWLEAVVANDQLLVDLTFHEDGQTVSARVVERFVNFGFEVVENFKLRDFALELDLEKSVNGGVSYIEEVFLEISIEGRQVDHIFPVFVFGGGDVRVVEVGRGEAEVFEAFEFVFAQVHRSVLGADVRNQTKRPEQMRVLILLLNLNLNLVGVLHSLQISDFRVHIF
jgi:hypothetical protein